MGWNPWRDIRRTVERGVKSVDGFIRDPLGVVKDPAKLAEGYSSFRIGGLPGQEARGNGQLVKQAQQLGKNPLQYVGNAAKEYGISNVGGIAGQISEDKFGNILNPSQPEPPGAGVDKRLEDIQREMKEDARKYRENLEYTRGQRMGGLLPEYQEAAREGTRRTRENYGRRGLLYSGLRKKGEGELKGKLASELARAQAGIREETERTAQMKEMAAAAQGLENASILMNQAEQYYNMSMQNDLARRRAFGLLGQGLGRAAGAYYGQQSSPTMQDSGDYALNWTGGGGNYA